MTRPAPGIALLASVRTADEARQAADGGADLIDLKEPRSGALGALPLAEIVAIVALLRARRPRVAISATVGDVPDGGPAAVEAWLAQRVAEVAATGVDYVKVGIAPGPRAPAQLDCLARLPGRRVPVLLADHGVDAALVARACRLDFPVVMLDTADKRRGSLFDCAPEAALADFIAAVRAQGRRAGLAGSLRLDHVPRLRALAPDIAGFRGALCDGDRCGQFDPRRLAALRAALDGAPQRSSVGVSSISRIAASSSLASRSTG